MEVWKWKERGTSRNQKGGMGERSEGWGEGGRDGEPLIIYDSLSFSKRRSSPAPCFPLTFNLSENQRVWSLIIVSVCQRLCLNLCETEVRSQHMSTCKPLSWSSPAFEAANEQSRCQSSLSLSELPGITRIQTQLTSHTHYAVRTRSSFTGNWDYLLWAPSDGSVSGQTKNFFISHNIMALFLV